MTGLPLGVRAGQAGHRTEGEPCARAEGVGDDATDGAADGGAAEEGDRPQCHHAPTLGGPAGSTAWT